MSQSRFVVYSLFIPVNLLNQLGGNSANNLMTNESTEVFYIFDMSRGVTLCDEFFSYDLAENKCNDENKSHAHNVQFKNNNYQKHDGYSFPLNERIILSCNGEDFERLNKKFNSEDTLEENLEIIVQSFKNLISEEQHIENLSPRLTKK
ncbi:hypothetical protein WKG99_14540 [Pantoea agglomerans]|uniref:hypothetical protein n=1 Tax=Enterobacter agglomerans TaxID=549 RepID=UPI003C7BA5A8